MCPDDTFVPKPASTSLRDCIACPDGTICPPGSRILLLEERFEELTFRYFLLPFITTKSLSEPDWIEIAEAYEDVEFESTFYFSAIYYILIIIGVNFIWVAIIYIPWPCFRSNSSIKSFQELALRVNFFKEQEDKEPHPFHKNKEVMLRFCHSVLAPRYFRDSL